MLLIEEKQVTLELPVANTVKTIEINGKCNLYREGSSYILMLYYMNKDKSDIDLGKIRIIYTDLEEEETIESLVRKGRNSEVSFYYSSEVYTIAVVDTV
jgi:hypothetical protein